jgi:hypothetical protein
MQTYGKDARLRAGCDELPQGGNYFDARRFSKQATSANAASVQQGL